MSKAKVVYYFHPDVGNYHYGTNHPMKPQRLAVLNHLVIGYGLHKKMEVRRSPKADRADICRYHSEDYIDFLRRISPGTAMQFEHLYSRYNIDQDCPIFPGMYEYCSIYSGASLEGAVRLNHKKSDIVINYSGGQHHAKKSAANGFCYVNDVVIAILELLKHHKRVLYIDVDVHHGDGVEEAFKLTDRVMTLSFHKFGARFFPGTGSIYDIGEQDGKYFSVNVPLLGGISDADYHSVFKPITASAIENFQPEVIVLQCGADSLCGDRLGCFNLSLEGHAECVGFVKGFNVPMLVLGGGGYNLENVARCWAIETGVLVGEELSDDIPVDTEYRAFFEPDFKLKPELTSKIENQNNAELLSALRVETLEKLRLIRGAPSVQMSAIPKDVFDIDKIMRREEPEDDEH